MPVDPEYLLKGKWCLWSPRTCLWTQIKNCCTVSVCLCKQWSTVYNRSQNYSLSRWLGNYFLISDPQYFVSNPEACIVAALTAFFVSIKKNQLTSSTKFLNRTLSSLKTKQKKMNIQSNVHSFSNDKCRGGS